MRLRTLWRTAMPVLGMPLSLLPMWLFLEWAHHAVWQSISTVAQANPLLATSHLREMNAMLLNTSEIGLGVVALAYGFVRALCYHPAANSRYAAWLQTVPWNYTKPLPLGPVHLVWHELLMLAAISALGWFRLSVPPALIPVAFAVGYCPAAAGLIFVQIGQGAPLYWLLIGMGALVRLWPAWWLMLGVAIILYGITWLGLRQSLKSFPWENLSEDAAAIKQAFVKSRSQSVSARPQPEDLGWPFSGLNPKAGKPMPGGTIVAGGVALGLLVGWWAYVIAFRSLASDPHVQAKFWGIAFALGIAIAFVRLGVYVGACLPPISIWGRIATGRLVIPRYDCVFIAPPCIVLASIFAFALCSRAGLSPDVALGTSIGVSLLMGIAMPPSRQRWRLTTPGRLCPSLGVSGLIRHNSDKPL